MGVEWGGSGVGWEWGGGGGLELHVKAFISG